MVTATNPVKDPIRRTSSDVVDRGKAIYRRELRSLLETPENIGKVLIIDVDTGQYLMGDDVNGFDDYEMDLRALRAFPDHRQFGMRIGYNAADAAGGVLQRLDRIEDDL